MREVRTCDVLVVGLGPAGSCASARASQHKLSVLAIDRRRRPGEPIQCAEFVRICAAELQLNLCLGVCSNLYSGIRSNIYSAVCSDLCCWVYFNAAGFI